MNIANEKNLKMIITPLVITELYTTNYMFLSNKKPDALLILFPTLALELYWGYEFYKRKQKLELQEYKKTLQDRKEQNQENKIEETKNSLGLKLKK